MLNNSWFLKTRRHPMVAVLLTCTLAGGASAASIDLTFKAITAEVSVNGAPPVKTDLAVRLVVNAGKLVTGGGYAGSDRYLNLTGFFSSMQLGFSNVEAVTPLDVHIGAPAATPPFQNSTVLLVSGDVVNGIFSVGDIGRWNRISSLGPLRGPATASAPLKVSLKNGSTLSITTLESERTFGNASFQATLVPEGSGDIRPTQNLVVDGHLRKLREKELILQTGDNRLVHIRLLAKTKFRDLQGAPVRDSLLRPGNQLSVTVDPDDPETALIVVVIPKRDQPGT